MMKLTIAVSLRIFTLLIICFYLFTFQNSGFSRFLLGLNPYILTVFAILLLLMARQQHVYKKSRPDEHINYREKILPEFNINDEREAEITGRAAKTALSLILIYSPFTLVIISFLMFYQVDYLILYTFLTIVSIPIGGLITYYLSYRKNYLS